MTKNKIILILIFLIAILATCKHFLRQNSVYKAQERQKIAEKTLNDALEEINNTTTDDFIDFTNNNQVEISIVNSEYSPKNIIIKKGTTVTWTNEDDMQHNVMREHEDSEIPHGAVTVENPNEFESRMLSKGDSYSFTFNEVSTYPYHCSPHPWMTGTVEVVE